MKIMKITQIQVTIANLTKNYKDVVGWKNEMIEKTKGIVEGVK